MPFRRASTISPVISTLSSFCGMSCLLSLALCVGRRTANAARRSNELREEVHVRGLRALVALLSLVLDLRALGERPVAAALDRAEVHEQVLATLIRGDEPVTLVRVEPLDSSGCHLDFHLLAELLNGQERALPAPSTTRSNCRADCSLVFHPRGRT